MYGIEEATGLGGLAAQAPGGDIYLPGAVAIRSSGSPVIGSAAFGGGLPYNLGRGTGAGGLPQISMDGGGVERPVSQSMGSWRDILDFHNSVAPWVLMLILLIYGWVHVSYKRGRLAAGGGVR